jgi:excisionase family DNA binding protein
MARTIDSAATTEKSSSAQDHDTSHGDERLTVKAAADLLNVDQRYLIGLLDAGRIPFTGTGARRHIRRDDLLAYKRERDAFRREGLRELTRMGEAAGMDDADYRALLPDPS